MNAIHATYARVVVAVIWMSSQNRAILATKQEELWRETENTCHISDAHQATRFSEH